MITGSLAKRIEVEVLAAENQRLRAACVEASKRIRAHRRGIHKRECACVDCEVIMQIERALGNVQPCPAAEPEPEGGKP